MAVDFVAQLGHFWAHARPRVFYSRWKTQVVEICVCVNHCDFHTIWGSVVNHGQPCHSKTSPNSSSQSFDHEKMDTWAHQKKSPFHWPQRLWTPKALFEWYIIVERRWRSQGSVHTRKDVRSVRIDGVRVKAASFLPSLPTNFMMHSLKYIENWHCQSWMTNWLIYIQGKPSGGFKVCTDPVRLPPPSGSVTGKLPASRNWTYWVLAMSEVWSSSFSFHPCEADPYYENLWGYDRKFRLTVPAPKLLQCFLFSPIEELRVLGFSVQGMASHNEAGTDCAVIRLGKALRFVLDGRTSPNSAKNCFLLFNYF